MRFAENENALTEWEIEKVILFNLSPFSFENPK